MSVKKNLLVTLFQFTLGAALLVCAIWTAQWLLGRLDVRSTNFVQASAISAPPSPVSEEIEVPEGTFLVVCENALGGLVGTESSEWDAVRDPSWANLRCQIREGAEKRVMAEFLFGTVLKKSKEGNTQTSCTETMYNVASRIWPHARISQEALALAKFPDYSDIHLISTEKKDRVDEIGAVKPLCFLGKELTANLRFTLEAPSVRAVVSDALTRAYGILDQRISTVTRDRIAAVVVDTFDTYSLTFEVRQMNNFLTDEEREPALPGELNVTNPKKFVGFDIPNGVRLLLSGTFEFVILSLGILALFSSFAAVLVSQFTATVGRSLGLLSVRLGGILTYLGLLGTLYGVFGAVQALSGMEFLNEFRKIFEQTASFGAMSLAIGTSVIGLGSAVLVGLVQSFLGFLGVRDPFGEG